MKLGNDTTKHEFTLDRVEGDKAILIGEDKANIVLPKKMLPSEAKEGSVLTLTISTDESETKKREKTAKELLNEILNIH